MNIGRFFEKPVPRPTRHRFAATGERVTWRRVLTCACLLLCVVNGGLQAAEAVPGIEELRSRLDTVQSANSMDPDLRASAEERYRQAIENIESATADRTRATGYAEALKSAPARLSQLQGQLESVEDVGGISVAEDLATLEKQLLARQTEQLRLRGELTDTIAAAAAERAIDLPAALATALQEQSAHASNLLDPVAADTDEVVDATRMERLSAVEASNARVEMLQQRQLSRDVRLSVLDARQQWLTRQINAAGNVITNLQDAVVSTRLEDAEMAARRTRERAATLTAENRPVAALAEENAAIARDISRVGARTENLLRQSQELLTERLRLARYRDSITQQLAVAGADRLADVGIELLAQRRNLDAQRVSVPALEDVDDEVTRAQLARLRMEDRQQAAAADAADATTGLVAELEAERSKLIRDAVTAYRRYVDALAPLRSEAHELHVVSAAYRDLLNSRLFWIPSAAPASPALWRGAGEELQWLVSAEQWRQVTSAVGNDGWRKGVPVSLLLLPAIVIIGCRRRLYGLLEKLATNVGKVQRDRAAFTWAALMLSVLLALPGPLVLTGLALLVGSGGNFANQFSTGLGNAAGLWFLLELFRQICRPEGLADRHFRWSAGTLATIRRNVPWLIWILVPVTLLTPLADGTVRDAMSRALFGIASVVLAVFANRVLRPAAPLAQSLAARQSRWRGLVRYVFYPVAVVMPLLLLGLSLYGFHFTALQLEGKLFVTAWLLVGIMLLYSLATRAVAVTERRMALERALAKRHAEREQSGSRQAADDAAEGVPDTLDMPEVDLDTINSQTRAFLRMLLALTAAFALWNIWSDILPALGVFDQIELWRVVSGNATTPDRVVTVASLLVAGLAVFMTVFGARNIPGSLEMSVLRRFDLDAGTSYAVTTIVKYVIVITGVTVVLTLIGAQWSKLQWLVAALGVGLGFGLQEIVANFVSGLLILFERPIRVGDTVTVGNHTGTVSRIRIRATTLTDWDRKEQVIPNKTFITEQLTNWTLSDPITRLIIRVGVAYGSDVEQVLRTLSNVVAKNERIIEDPPPAIFFVGFGDSSLDFEIRVFIKRMLDMMPLTHEMHVEIERGLREAGIEIPFPQRDIWIRTAEDVSGAELNADSRQANTDE